MEADDPEAAIPDFERALRELPRRSPLRRDALVGLARAQIAVGDEEAAHATIDALEAFDEDRPADDDDGIDVGWLAVAISLAVAEVGLLVAGASLRASAPGCEPTAVLCDRSQENLSTGLLVAGSLGWIAPAVLFGLLGALSGESGVAPFGSVRDPALVRF